MTDFIYLLARCKEVSVLSVSVLDEFLMYYIAGKERLEKEMDQRLARFRNVTRRFDPGWVNLIKAQYICHRIFKEGGLIKKYLNNAAVKALPEEQRLFLHQQSAVPWRYSYSVIIANPEPDFYEMEDAFNEERFLLYSPSVTKTLSEQKVSLWFNLISFNGSCWQSFGPVIYFLSLEPDDIFFFAAELNLGIGSEEDVMADIEENPFPYLMLLSVSNYPFIINDNEQILHVIAEHPADDIDSLKLRENFKLEYVHGVYRIKPTLWSDPPYFAAAYFDEQKNTILLTSMTDMGFLMLVFLLNDSGFNLPDHSDIRLQIPMVMAIKEILGRELELNPYEKLFEVSATTAEKDNLTKLNTLLSLALPIINSGQEPDVEALAKEAGVDVETARDLLRQSINRIKRLRDQTDKKS